METTISLAKEHGLAALTLLAVLYFHNDLSGDIQSLRTEMGGEFQTIRAEMSADHQAIRAEIAADHQSIRSEMVKGDQALRAEMTKGFQAIRADISALGERMARVETRVGGIEERLERDLPQGD